MNMDEMNYDFKSVDILCVQEKQKRAIAFLLATFVKTPSTHGRYFIARNAIGLIAEAPLTDHGANGFDRAYMPRQAEYFRHHSDPEGTVCNSNSSKYECLSLVHKDTEGNLFIEIELKVNPSEIGIIQVPCFCVEEEIFQPNEDCLDSVVHILPGTFEYKQNIGVNGGYKIPLAYEAKTY